MNKIRVIDLLNKIANGEEVPNHIRYAGIDLYYNKKNNCYDLIMSNVREEFYTFSYSDLNNEIEILEEEKKIPEKIKVKGYDKCIHDVTHKEKEFSLDIRELQIRYNDLLDYLKSKGE